MIRDGFLRCIDAPVIVLHKYVVVTAGAQDVDCIHLPFGCNINAIKSLSKIQWLYRKPQRPMLCNATLLI